MVQFTNSSNGNIIALNSNAANLFFLSGSSVSNDGLIRAGSGSTQGLANSGTVSNNVLGIIEIDDTGTHGLSNFGNGIITNAGQINIGSNGVIAEAAFQNNGTFTNSTDGYVQLDAVERGIYNIGNLTNDGEMKIGSLNNFTIAGIENWTAGAFNNNICATIELYDNLINTSTTILVNDGYFYINTIEPHTEGLFDNNGVISDPQMGLDQNATGFTNSNIIITNTIANACPTEIKPAFNRVSSFIYNVEGIYTNAAATVSAGTYIPLSNTFVPTATLMHNTSYTYYVKLQDQAMNCEIIVEWTVTTGDDTIIFTGLGDGIDWHDPT